ncbi:hypothetical protein Leryth_000789 [Lithospermum erythrorhizon]|nr:hypothetical protein Leryth_000789 [Lithospermum erythrorhizon]
MEGGEQQKSPQTGYPAENGDAKYISGLSTILVATIEEAKDRISQIEYIFCSQLYPNFQSKSKSLQKVYYEARKAAEDEYKVNENNLLLQMETLRETLKQKANEVNVGKEAQLNLENIIRSKDSLLVDKDNMLKELEERNNMLVKKQKSLELEVERLRCDLIILAEHEQKQNELTDKLERTLKHVEELQSECEEKNAEIDLGKDLNLNLLRRIESRDSELMQNEQLLRKYENENRLLLDKVDNLNSNIDQIQRELQGRIKELKDGGNLQAHQLQKIDLEKQNYYTEKKQEDLEKQNDYLLAKLKDLQMKVDQLQVNPLERSNESDERTALHEKLLHQIKARDSELHSERKKIREMIIAYKKLKSQYNFLLTKVSPTRIRDDAEAKLNQIPITSPVTGNADEQDLLENGKVDASIQQTKSLTPTSNILAVPEHKGNVKSCPPAGTKRNASYWRDTRSHQSRNGDDLHDDFLDTPLENLRGNQEKTANDKILPEPLPENMAFNNSDDETQDMNVNSSSKKEKLASPRTGVSGFKFVEPVRKKDERDKLKGIECKQCKKFYDVVLPNEGNGSGGINNVRCEHHNGVSRHRYRYEPPSTPDGFWNIGFESEM